MVENLGSLFSKKLEEPPSCIEFCPGHERYVVVGTYLLSSSNQAEDGLVDQRRRGSLILLELDSTTGAEYETLMLYLCTC